MKRTNLFLTIGFVLSVNVLRWSHAELYTAIADMEPLLETHKRIIDDLDDYISKEERRLIRLKKHLNVYKEEHEKAMDDIPNYLGNPIHAFTLIKRLTTDLDYIIEHSIKIGTEYIKNITMNHNDVKYPTMEDLTGAAQALTRLQETYHLDVSELAEGLINGVAYSTPMSVSDCIELGRALYNHKDYKNSISWMTQALNKYGEDEGPHLFTEVEILEYISFSYFLNGEVKNALTWTRKLLELDPKHPRARGNIPHYEKTLAEEEKRLWKQRRGETGEETPQPQMSQYARERKNYEALCRGETNIDPDVARRLTCKYLTENNPFLRLAAVKTEQLYINPDIYLFYDVISDNEIKQIKEMARPKFKRAVVHDPKTGELVPAHYRISKSAWLRDSHAPVVERLSRRVADLSGLSMTSAEELQVVNYGIGGHYEPHFDFARRQENAFANFNGNRIATILFYMSDVGQGGATVFTELGLRVAPVKGAAAFWMNLHPSGEGDLATRHAACPVLRGSKWVCNKWVHQGGQELLKPCNLQYQDEGMLRPPRVSPSTQDSAR